MKVIVAGSRNFTDYSYVVACIKESRYNISELVCGEAQGVDSLAKKWATTYGLPIKSFPARWDKYGKSAGPRRNQQMADYADALIAIWDLKSPGTRNMISLFETTNKPFIVFKT